MNMKLMLVIALLTLYVAVAFGWRSWLHKRRTGSAGFRGISGRPLSAEWCGGVLLVVGLLASSAAPLVAVAGVAVWSLPSPVGWIGFGVLGLGVAGTLAAQLAMGASWRIGVDPRETTTLVTGGLFRWVRNPIFTSMLAVSLAIILLVPGWCATAGFATALLGLELQVRLVEEPYLLRTHPPYRAYAARVGRFVPGFGRLAAPPDPTGEPR
jgi:protein-S-isoprenylcysteine O-methyltransferase Ste14